MLTTFDKYMQRISNGFLSQRHFTVQQDATTSAPTNLLNGQLIGPISKIENSLPTGVTGYRLISGSLISSTATHSFFIVKKHVFGQYSLSTNTYTYNNNPLSTIYSGNTNNTIKSGLYVYHNAATVGSSATYTITYTDPSTQTFGYIPGNNAARGSCILIPTATSNVIDVTNVSRTAGTGTSGTLELIALNVISQVQNISALTTTFFSFNNLTQTIPAPLLIQNEELYLLTIGNTVAKGIRGQISLVGEEA